MTLLLGPSAETWAVQSGDLLGDLQGFTRGVRLAWGLRSRWQQRVGVERSRLALASTAPVVSGGSTWSLTDTLMAGGDISSDGALLLRSR